MNALQLIHRQLLGTLKTPSFAAVSLGLMLMPTVAVGQSVEERIDALTRELEALRLGGDVIEADSSCLLYTSPSPRDATLSRMPSSA